MSKGIDGLNNFFRFIKNLYNKSFRSNFYHFLYKNEIKIYFSPILIYLIRHLLSSLCFLNEIFCFSFLWLFLHPIKWLIATDENYTKKILEFYILIFVIHLFNNALILLRNKFAKYVSRIHLGRTWNCSCGLHWTIFTQVNLLVTCRLITGRRRGKSSPKNKRGPLLNFLKKIL